MVLKLFSGDTSENLKACECDEMITTEIGKDQHASWSSVDGENDLARSHFY